MPSYYLWTMGCQMNAADAARTRQEMEQLGFCSVSRPTEADLLVLITCVVRQSAEDKVVGRLTSLQGLKHRRPDAVIVVMGCFVNDEDALRARFPYVDFFLRPSDVDGLLEIVRQRFTQAALRPEPAHASSPPSAVTALIPISEGCDHRCTYCIVRLRRGRQRSRPLADILREAQQWVQRGAREITLLGQNVDAYGHDWGSAGPRLADVLSALHKIDGLRRIRFLTSHPADMSLDLVRAVANLPKVCPHFELPVQSGDDLILRRMGRSYTVSEYRQLVSSIREIVGHCSIITDVIVGFPGESEDQFEATYKLMDSLRFDAVHIAKYSPRLATPAARLVDDVPTEEKERRRARLEALQKRIAGEINAELLHQTVEVLVEDLHRGRWRGRTRTNKLVFFEDATDRERQLVDVQISQTGPWSLRGRLVGLKSGAAPPARP